MANRSSELEALKFYQPKPANTRPETTGLPSLLGEPIACVLRARASRLIGLWF